MANDTTNAQRLAEFFGRWDKDFETIAAAFREFFTEDAAWWNADALPLVHGYDESLEKVFIPSRDTALGMQCISVTDLIIAKAGSLSFHERARRPHHRPRSVATGSHDSAENSVRSPRQLHRAEVCRRPA